MPRIVVQQDAPRPAWSCGTIAMCTTLHLLLREPQLRELPGQHITRTRMLVLHRALLKWLIAGTSPALWQLGCLHQDIHPPTSAHTDPYPLLSISATTSLTKGQPWRALRPLSIEPTLDHRIAFSSERWAARPPNHGTLLILPYRAPPIPSTPTRDTGSPPDTACIPASPRPLLPEGGTFRPCL